MTRGELAITAWLVPLWVAAVYQFSLWTRYVSAAQRPEYRTGVEPFIVWHDDCLTKEGLLLRRRGVRAMRRFLLIVVVAFIGGFLIDRWLKS
jgi:hypothetical protein